MLSLKKDDSKNLAERGVSKADVMYQAKLILEGRKYLELTEPATIANGRIYQIQAASFDELEKIWCKEIADRTIKFIPASGAASRMFRALNLVLGLGYENISDVTREIDELGESAGESQQELDELSNLLDFKKFWELLDTFPFYKELSETLVKAGISIVKEVYAGRIQNILRYLLCPEGMDYAASPKLLLTFHENDSVPTTAMEEHIKEALLFTGGRVHFTVSPSHLKKAKALADGLTKRYKKKGSSVNISFSIQEPSTDVIALKLDGSDFIRNPPISHPRAGGDPVGSLFFRQSGHGALSLNLNRLDSPYILLQNVDNLPGSSKEIVEWKRAFLGYFGKILGEIYNLTKQLRENAPEKLVEQAYKFITIELKRPIDNTKYKAESLKGKASILFNSINRPFVLAGMVPNKGEPGGGPFVVKDSKMGVSTNQIVEGAQQNKKNSNQKDIIKDSTHFNPVFLILNTEDAWGKKFDLQKYAKREGGYVFYVEKSDATGQKFASIDTGLWNGEIADMIIAFVEMPAQTFGPAKTVLDLTPNLRPFRKNPYPG